MKPFYQFRQKRLLSALLLIFISSVYATAQGVITGTLIGHSGSWNNNPATTISAGVDNDFATYIDAPSSIGYVGYDFGEGVVANLTSVQYAPRATHPQRMVGNVIYGTNNSADVGTTNGTALYTITDQPAINAFTEATVTTTDSYRYIYLRSVNSCNLSEIKFYGTTTTLKTETISENIKIEVYPNPSPDGNFKVSLNNLSLPGTTAISVKVISALGQTLWENKLDPSTKTFEINTSLPHGIYIVTFADTFKTKLVVK